MTKKEPPSGMILVTGNPILRQKASPVESALIRSQAISSIVKKMSEALRATDDGIGIAASQIGEPIRIFIASEEAKYARADTEDDNEPPKPRSEWKHYIFINPLILKSSKKTSHSTEGCLSVPGFYGSVTRHEKVRIEAFDKHGKKFQVGASGLFARLMQHEMDHLDGILFTDKASDIQAVSKSHEES